MDADYAMSTSTKAHGLDGSLVEPDWPPLTAEEVRAVLRTFAGLDGPVEILSVSPRPFSAASVVRAGGGRVFVKRHSRSVRDGVALLEEHRFMAHLRAHGCAVPEVLQTASGETALACNEWTYEVHSIPPGIDAYGDAISWTPFRAVGYARAAGAALARLHKAATGFDARAREIRPLVGSFSIFADMDASDSVQRYLAARPALSADAQTRQDCAEALQLLAPFHAELKLLLPRLDALWTHNDLHASNLFWTDASEDARPTAVIDFGLADRTFAVHDLAVAIERNVVEWLRLGDPDMPVHLDHLFAMLDGYESVRLLSQHELAALAPMLALCHAEFALTEADYFLGVLHSPGKARVATHDYLVAHARWFRSEAGERLLDSIRAWAAVRTPGAVAR
jgi:Ser/Thr protein kinase RdoA (MazF antagonist)